MALREEFEQLGNWFFRWRSYLPLVLTAFFIVALKNAPNTSIQFNRAFEFLCVLVSFIGLAIRMYAVGCAPRGTSGRNVTEQRADSLNKTGIYSLIRHPLYFGNFFIWFGISLFTGSWWVVLITTFAFWFYYEKMMFAEEEYLRRQFGEAYLSWAERTPAFLPTRFYQWKPPHLRFKFKNALRREYSGFFAIISIFSLMKLIKDTVAAEELVVDSLWLFIFLLSLIIYLSLMYLKKKTTLLDIRGR